MDNSSNESIGKRIRQIRTSKKITLEEVGNKTGLTPSFISQFERGLSQASIGSINKIANAIGAKMSTLFSDIAENGNGYDYEIPSIVRFKDRLQLYYPGQMKDYLLSDPKRSLEAFYGEIEPYGTSSEVYIFHGDEEFLLILEGSLKIEVANHQYTLNEGDSMGFHAQSPHRWWNETDQTVRLLWVISKSNINE